MSSIPTAPVVNNTDSEKKAPRRFDPAQFPLTEQDHVELTQKRGLTDETIITARLGSVRTQGDLDSLGIKASFDGLASTIIIPYGPPDEAGLCVFRLHKRSLPGTTYPPYTLPRRPGNVAVLCESEFKALAAWQLGFNAIGLQGIHSHLRRFDEIAAAAKAIGCTQIVILLDTVRGVGGLSLSKRDEPPVAHAYALALEERGLETTVGELPEPYLQETLGSDGSKYLRADVDGAVAAGMTSDELAQQVSAALSFWDSSEDLSVRADAFWLAKRDSAFRDQNAITKLLAGASVQHIERALNALAHHARSNAFDPDKLTYNRVFLDTFAAQLRDLFRPHLPGLRIETVRALVKPVADKEQNSGLCLGDYSLATIDNRLFHIKNKGQINEEFELVANFAVQEIRTGKARFLDEQCSAIHNVEVTTGTPPESHKIELLGSIYDPKDVVKAGGDALTIAKPAHYRTYISHRVEVDRIQKQDSRVDRVYVVGACLDDNGNLQPNDHIAFPQQREECHYHLHRFADNGDKPVFHRVAALFRDSSVALILLFGLGTIFKPLLSWVYPHLVVEGDSGVGKSTLLGLLKRLFGWRVFSGKLEFGTAYRGKKLLSNSIMPMQVEEVGRVHGESLGRMVDFLNQSYNLTPGTHGHLDKRFCLVTPAILYGQDFPVEDVALRAKLVRVRLLKAAQDPSALQKCRAVSAMWPMRDWVNFACDWANERNLEELVQAEQIKLEGRVVQDNLNVASNTGRLIFNYAVLPVVAQALRAFGVPVDVDEYICEALRSHLRDLSGDDDGVNRSTVAKQFVADVCDHIQSAASTRGLINDWTPKGLFIKVKNALDVLRRQGRRYDISTPRRLQEMLFDEGLATKSVKHRFGGIECRCVLISTDVLQELGYHSQRAAAIQERADL